MGSTVTLRASARYGYGGKQFIARILGRDSKLTFKREFVGRKWGKRGEESEAMVDDPGIYERRSVDSKGRVDDQYLFVWQDEAELRIWPLTKEEAMGYAKRLEKGEDPNALAREDIVITMRSAVEEETAKDPDELVPVMYASAELCRLDPEERYPRKTVMAARQVVIRRLAPDSVEVPAAVVTDGKEPGVVVSEEAAGGGETRMTAEERARLERALEGRVDVIVRGLVELVDGTADVLKLPGGWRIRLDPQRSREE